MGADIDTSTAQDHRDPLRLATLHDYRILDSPADPGFDDITDFVARHCEAPVALVSLVEDDRQWFKSVCGTDLDGTPIGESVCVHALAAGDYLEIEDLRADDRTAMNPLVKGPMGLRFYAGAVLRAANGQPLGALCVLDTRPRRLNAEQRATLRMMGRQVMRLIELHRALEDGALLRKEVDHRVKNSLQSISSLIKIRRRGSDPAVGAALDEVDKRIRAVAGMHEALYRSAAPEMVRLGDFLEEFHEQMRGLMPPAVTVAYSTDPLEIPARQAMSLAMIVAEFVSNSLKHGFPDERGGQVAITGRARPGAYELLLADDGVGPAPGGSDGIGLRVMRATATQMGAGIEVLSPPSGYAIRLTLTPQGAATAP